MQKIKFDFEATKQLVYAPNSTAPIGAPVDADGNVANDGTAIGIVLCRRNENNKYWVKQNLVVMVAGYCDIIDAQAIWGDEYSAEAIAAMSDIVFCDDHKIGGGGGWPADLPKPSVGGYGYTEHGDGAVITWDGDTEGREAIYAEAEGQRLETHYKVSDLTFTGDSVLGGKVTMSGVDYDIRDINVVDNESDGYTSSTAQFTAVLVESMAVISCNTTGVIRVTLYGNTVEYHCPTTGIYFVSFASWGQDSFVSSLTYGTPDTIHKIDEKYLPESGAMVVNITGGPSGVTADKSIQEICESYFSGIPIIAKCENEYERFVLTAVGATASANEGWTVFFGMNGGASYDISVLKGVQDADGDRWKYGVN